MNHEDSQLPPPPTPAPAAPESTWWSGIARLGTCGILIANLLGLAISATVGTLVIPRFGAVIADTGQELPALTVLMLSIPRVVYPAICFTGRADSSPRSYPSPAHS